MQIEILKPAKNQNESFGHGMVLKVTCNAGFNSNIQTVNSTVRCNKGVWKPVKPMCTLSKNLFVTIIANWIHFFLQNPASFLRSSMESSTKCQYKNLWNNSSRRINRWHQWTRSAVGYLLLSSATLVTTFKVRAVWSVSMATGRRSCFLNVCHHHVSFRRLCMLRIRGDIELGCL